MVRATRALLDSDPKNWGTYPKRLFAYGPGGQIEESIARDNPIFKMKLPV
jgi:hypothetical protein